MPLKPKLRSNSSRSLVTNLSTSDEDENIPFDPSQQKSSSTRYNFHIDPRDDPHMFMSLNVCGTSYTSESEPNKWTRIDSGFHGIVLTYFQHDLMEKQTKMNKRTLITLRSSNSTDSKRKAEYFSNKSDELWKYTSKHTLSNAVSKRKWIEWRGKTIESCAEDAKEEIVEQVGEDFEEQWVITI